MSSWLVCVATPGEVDLLGQRLSPAEPLLERPRWRGRVGGLELTVLVTGLGPVNAGLSLATQVAREGRPDAVLSLGCCGAYASSGLAVGQAVLASETVFADLGVISRDGFQDLEAVRLPLWRAPEHLPIHNRIPCDPHLNERVLAANPGLPVGAFCTVNQISGDAMAAQVLAQRWLGVAEDMESAGLALAALRLGLAFTALRGVSNQCGDRRLDVAAGARAAERALLNLEEPR